LHRTKSEATSFAQSMLAHFAPHAKASGTKRNHERRVGYMGARAGLVRPQDVSTDDISLMLRDVARIRRMQPVRETVFPCNPWIKRIGIATSDDRMKDAPDGVTVQRRRLAYLQHQLPGKENAPPERKLQGDADMHCQPPPRCDRTSRYPRVWPASGSVVFIALHSVAVWIQV